MNQQEFQQVSKYGSICYWEGTYLTLGLILLVAFGFVHFYLEPQLLSIVLEQARANTLSTRMVGTASLILDMKKYLLFGGIGSISLGFYYSHKKSQIDQWIIR
jgi:hypothetical protein